MADGGTKDAEFIAEQTLEVLEDSGLLGFNFKDHFGVIWMVGASNNSLAGEVLESPHGLPDYPQCMYIYIYKHKTIKQLALSLFLFPACSYMH
jgi:hypothetical protein